MAILPRPFSLDGHLVVIKDGFYKVQSCTCEFDPCGLCEIMGEHIQHFCNRCPLAPHGQYLEVCRDVTEDMKKGAEQLRIDNPDAAWFLLRRDEGRPPQNEQPHNSDNMETTKTTFRDIAGRIADLQEKKNESYGNAFGQSCDKYGVVSALTRLNDKLNRLDSLYKSSMRGTGAAPSPQMAVSVFGESFTDTLTDLAAYAIMTIEWLETRKNDENP